MKHHIESCSQFIVGFEECVVSNGSLIALFHRFMPDILDGRFVIPDEARRGEDAGWTARC